MERYAQPNVLLVDEMIDFVNKTLYIAAHASEIVGHPDGGLKVINELIEHCTQPKYTVSIKWEQAGDLVRASFATKN